VFIVLAVVLIGIGSVLLPPIFHSEYSLPVNFHQNISVYPFCLPLPPFKKQYGDWDYITYSVSRSNCLFQIATSHKDPNICEYTGNRDCWKDYGEQTENPLECELLPEKSTARFQCLQGFFQVHSHQSWCNRLKLESSDRIDLGCDN